MKMFQENEDYNEMPEHYQDQRDLISKKKDTRNKLETEENNKAKRIEQQEEIIKILQDNTFLLIKKLEDKDSSKDIKVKELKHKTADNFYEEVVELHFKTWT